MRPGTANVSGPLRLPYYNKVMITVNPRLADLFAVEDPGYQFGLKRYCTVERKQLVVTGL